MKSSLTIADKLLQLAEDYDKPLTPMQLIKLVYLCHGWMLGAYGRPLISDDVEAWRYGPVINNLYQEVKHFKDKPVHNSGYSNINEDLDEEESDIVKQVFDIYGARPALSLSSLTHELNTPWDITQKNSGYSSVISNDIIESHYNKLMLEKFTS